MYHRRVVAVLAHKIRSDWNSLQAEAVEALRNELVRYVQ